MGKSADLIGQTFGRLTVTEKTDQRKHRQIVWKCQCSCGNEHLATTNHLNMGQVQSCGCLQADQNRTPSNVKHGGKRHAKSEYFTWLKTVGDREERWDDFLEFFCDVGERPSRTHRLLKKDARKPHSKENTIWSNHLEQRTAADKLTERDLPEECIFDFRTHLRSTATAG